MVIPLTAGLSQAAKDRIRDIEKKSTEAYRSDVLSTYFEAVSQANGNEALLEAAHVAKRQGYANVHAMQREHAELYEFPIGGDWTVFKKKGRKKLLYDHPTQGRWESKKDALEAAVSGKVSSKATPNGSINCKPRGRKKGQATTTSAKKRKSTTTSAKKGKATTTSAKKGKATAKTVSSDEEVSASYSSTESSDSEGNYSPSDGSDSEVEEITASLPARARSGRASGKAATKKVSYIESDQEISDECEGDYD
jgi:hypothetical protein